jgi:ankyrin repeat protein
MKIWRCFQTVGAMLLLTAGCAKQDKLPSTRDVAPHLQARLEAVIADQDFDGVRSALSAGARADVALPSGLTPLLEAAQLQNVSIVRLLLQSGADPNEPIPRSPTTPLAVAVYSHGRALVEELLKAGADPNKRFEGGMTPLGRASVALGGAAIGSLVAAGADVNAWNLDPASDYPGGYHPGKAEGRTALMMAAASGNDLAVLELLECGADPTLRNERGLAAIDLVRDHAAEIRGALARAERSNAWRKR